MNLQRRAVLAGAVAVVAASLAKPTSAHASSPDAAGVAAQFADLVAAAAADRWLTLSDDGRRFGGPALDMLLRDARNAQFFLLGEEHGIAENPRLAAQLFQALVPAGYRKLTIETSPPAANFLDKAAAHGVAGIAATQADPTSRVAFFGLREEAEMLAAVRAALPAGETALWGVDYEVAADRRLIAELEAARKPPAAAARLVDLKAASNAAWKTFAETHNPQFIFSFHGDPVLVRAVRNAWPQPDAASAWILDTLEQTLEINRLWIKGNGPESNVRRAANIRTNFLRHWMSERKAGRSPRVMVKMGANHLMRGCNAVGQFDLGSLLPELASIEGGTAFSMFVLPGKTAQTAVFNPVTWSSSPAAPKDGYANGLSLITDRAPEKGFSLLDLRPLRAQADSRLLAVYPELFQLIHGYDSLLLMTGSTPSKDL